MIEFNISNRKYLGSKTRLLPFITNAILEKTNNQIGHFADLFSGTGIVSDTIRKLSCCTKVTANDILYSNYVVLDCFLRPETIMDSVRISYLVEKISNSLPVWGYAFHHYGSLYFSWDNAAMIDGIRETINSMKSNVSEWEYNTLLTSLIYAADRAANTCGQYDAFLKHIHKDSYNLGTHQVDENAKKPLALGVPALTDGAESVVYCDDANKLLEKLDCDTLYLDPPYNSRQYSDLYHVLENIARWEKPVLKGATKKFDRSHLKSDYSSKAKVASVFLELVNKTRCKHLFLSYNNEGLMSDKTIRDILSRKGKVEVFESEYPVFGNGAGVSKKRNVIERLYYAKC